MLTTIAQTIHDLLSAEKSAALNGTIPIFPTLRIESTTIAEFDIMDKKPTIIQVVGKGAATYHNASERTISIFDYENFVNNLHSILQKNERRPDFIAIDNNASKIVINELSTGNPKSKKSDAIYQMNHLVQLLKRSLIWKNVVAIPEKECVFSCRQNFASTPQNTSGKGMADSFGTIQTLLAGPIELKFQPITKAGFKLYQSDCVNF